MEKRVLGKTGLDVTCLGFGSAQVGFLDCSLGQAESVLNGLLDAGIGVIDTAACYGNAEELIGKAVSGRRDEYVLVSKCGHHVLDSDPAEWTGGVVGCNVRRSLELLKTDCLDVLLLHSCSAEELRGDGLVEALVGCKEKGLARFIGYSGDGDDAVAALEYEVFDCLETSISVCDQQVLDMALVKAREKNIGVIAKRPIANTCWRIGSNTESDYVNYIRPYCERLEKMGLSCEAVGFDGSMVELALRFSVFQAGVSTAIIGGRNIEHIKENIAIVGKGPLPAEVVEKIREIWGRCDDGSWVGKN